MFHWNFDNSTVEFTKSGLSLWRTLQNISEIIFFTEFFLGKIMKKWSILTFFFGYDRHLTPLRVQGPLGGVLWTACACDFRGVPFQVDLTRLSLVKWFEERPKARVTIHLDTQLVKFHSCPKHRCRTLTFFSLEPTGQGLIHSRLGVESTVFQSSLLVRWVELRKRQQHQRTGGFPSHGTFSRQRDAGSVEPDSVEPCSTLKCVLRKRNRNNNYSGLII